MKAKKVVAIKDGFMDITGRQFCIKGKEYAVTDHSAANMFSIISELTEPHWFDYNNEWLKAVESEGE